jgi:hypothetical protein
MGSISRMAARVTRKVPLHESIFKLNEKLNMLMAEMKKLRYVVLQAQGQAQVQGQQAPLQEQEEVELQPLEEAPLQPSGPGRRSDWHYWGANWAAKNPDIPRDANFSLKMAEAYRAWKEAHPGQTYLDFRGTDVIDGRRRLTQKKGKKVSPAPLPIRQATPPLAPAPLPIRQATPPLAPAPLPIRQATPPLAPAPLPIRQATPPSRQKTPNAYKQPSPGPLSTPSLLQGRRETPPQEYYEPEEEQDIMPQQEKPVRVPIQEESVEESPEEEQEMSPEEEQEMSPEEGEVEVSPEEEQEMSPEEEQEMSPEEEQEMSPEEEQEVPPQEEQALSPEEEASIEAAQQQQPEASPEWPEEEQEGDLEIVTVGQQEYFRTSNNGLFTVIRDEEGNPDIGSWAGVLSDDGTQVVETEQPEEP